VRRNSTMRPGYLGVPGVFLIAAVGELRAR
jgi:hypothetical protein